MKTTAQHLQDVLCDGFSLDIGLTELESGIFSLSTPFRFPDGDDYQIYLDTRSESNDILISDMGHTLMQYSYTHDVDHLIYGSRKNYFARALSDLDITINDGTLSVVSNANKLTDDVFRFGQAITRIMDLAIRSNHQFDNQFKTDIGNILLNPTSEQNIDLKINYQVPTLNEPDLYPVDFALFAKDKTPLFLFAISNTPDALMASLAIKEFKSKNILFDSMIVVEDYDSLPSQDYRRLNVETNLGTIKFHQPADKPADLVQKVIHDLI